MLEHERYRFHPPLVYYLPHTYSLYVLKDLPSICSVCLCEEMQWSLWERKDPDLNLPVTPQLCFYCPSAHYHLHLSSPVI